jgi:putative endonuclease
MNPVQWYRFGNPSGVWFLMRSHELGKWGEDVAAEYLQSKGFIILDRNWRCEDGELDIVALDGEAIVVVEVRTRSSDTYGTPEESLTSQKRRHLQNAALAYLQKKDRLDAVWRIDVVAIDAHRSGDLERIEHYTNAIEGERES